MGGLLTGSWSDESCLPTGSAYAECQQITVGRGTRGLSVAAEYAAAKATPSQHTPACRSFQVECNFQPDFRECLEQDPRKFRES